MKLQTRLFLGYLVVFVLMLVIAGVSYNGFRTNTATGRWVSHTHQVIADAQLVLRLAIDMETGQRGFLLAGEDEFLEPYLEGGELYQVTMKRLQKEVADNPAQVRRLEKIDRLIAKWQSVAAEPEIAARRLVKAGAIDADFLQQVLAEGVGKDILDEMRQIMDVMDANFRIDGNVKGSALTEAMAKAMVDAETGERGFLITGKDEFLAPYTDGKAAMRKSIQDLEKLVANAHDRIATVNNIDRLEALGAEWLRDAGEPEIEMRRQVDLGNATQKDLEDELARGGGVRARSIKCACSSRVWMRCSRPLRTKRRDHYSSLQRKAWSTRKRVSGGSSLRERTNSSSHSTMEEGTSLWRSRLCAR